MQAEGQGFPEKSELRTTGSLVVQGREDVTRLTAQTLSQTEKLLCACSDRETPPVFAGMPVFREMFIELKRRGVIVRYVTDVTQDNIQYCKKIMEEFGFELRHLEGIKGNFGVADRDKQYWTSARVENSSGHSRPQLLWSDVPAIVEQNQYIFDVLWDRAVPAEARFLELEQGVSPERTEVIFGEDNVLNSITSVIRNARSRVHVCVDPLGPSASLSIEPIRLAIAASGSRKVTPLYITEITGENIADCRKLVELGVELRHIDGVKGNFGVTDDEYCASSTLEGSKPILQLVYSNSKAIVEQHEYLFQTLWNRATPAPARFKEIDEGIQRYETRILRDPNQILSETKRMAVTSRRYSVSSVSGGLLYAYNYAYDDFAEILEKATRGEHEGIKWVTRIDESTLEAAKKFMEKGMLLRHLDSVPTESFGVSDREVGVTISRIENGTLNNSAIFSDDPMYVEHYTGGFEELWKSGVDANVRIKEIEEGVEEPRVTIIRNRSDVQELLLRLLNQASEEILLLLPSSNSYRRQERIGVIDSMQKAAERGVKVRLLTPRVYTDDDTKNLVEYKAIREATGLNTVTIAVVDRTRSLIIEQQDDTKQEFIESIGVATYSTRGSTVKANIRFFERMWEEVAEREREEVLLEKERRSRMEAELLQDILAHDIRNYNQAARLNAELISDELGTASAESLKPLVDSVINSIDGSTRLVERAAKIGKILTEGSNVNLFPVNVAETVGNAAKLVKESQRGKQISIETPTDLDKKSVMADDMLLEVFVNLFSNSAKYTNEKEVQVGFAVDEVVEKGTPFYRIAVSDHSHGIPDEQKSSLFTRYLKSARGSGLGLSIVHALVSDRYQGKITVRDRVKGDYTKGTVMEILLPKA